MLLLIHGAGSRQGLVALVCWGSCAAQSSKIGTFCKVRLAHCNGVYTLVPAGAACAALHQTSCPFH
jgi:hypothetical protein